MSDVAMMSLIATGMPDNGPGRRTMSWGRYSNALSRVSAAFAFSRQVAAYSSAIAGSRLNCRRSSRTPASERSADRPVGSVMPANPRQTSRRRGVAWNPSRSRLFHRHGWLDEFLNDKGLVVWLSSQVAKRDLGIHGHFQRVRRDIYTRGIDAVSEHPLHGGFHHDRIQGRKFLFGVLAGLGLVLGHEAHRHFHCVDKALGGVRIDIV